MPYFVLPRISVPPAGNSPVTFPRRACALRNKCRESKEKIPYRSAEGTLLEGALDCVRSGFIPGGLKNNREFAECLVGSEANVPEEIRTILFDPQTASGLLLSVARSDTELLLMALNMPACPAVEIGEVLPQEKLIRVV